MAGWIGAFTTGLIAAFIALDDVFEAGFITSLFVLPSIILFAVLGVWTRSAWAKHVGFVLPFLLIEGFCVVFAWSNPNDPEGAAQWAMFIAGMIAVEAAGAFLLEWWVFKAIVKRPFTAGLCPSCGYDLRATPERCPECGHAVRTVGA